MVNSRDAFLQRGRGRKNHRDVKVSVRNKRTTSIIQDAVISVRLWQSFFLSFFRVPLLVLKDVQRRALLETRILFHLKVASLD